MLPGVAPATTFAVRGENPETHRGRVAASLGGAASVMAPDIVGASPRGAYVLRVVFADGEVRDVDMAPLLDGPVFEPLRIQRSSPRSTSIRRHTRSRGRPAPTLIPTCCYNPSLRPASGRGPKITPSARSADWNEPFAGAGGGSAAPMLAAAPVPGVRTPEPAHGGLRRQVRAPPTAATASSASRRTERRHRTDRDAAGTSASSSPAGRG